MARAQLGVAPANPTDEVTLGWVRYEYPSYSTSVEATADFLISLPATESIDGPQMQLFEVYNAADIPIVAMIPDAVQLTTGLSRSIILDTDRTAFLGFRYSPRADKWFFLSATVQQTA